MVKTFTDESIMELHRRDMVAMREKLRQYDSQTVRLQLGIRPKRYQQFMRGDLDNQLKAWFIKKIHLFLEYNRPLKKSVNSKFTFRLVGDPEKLIQKINS